MVNEYLQPYLVRVPVQKLELAGLLFPVSFQVSAKIRSLGIHPQKLQTLHVSMRHRQAAFGHNSPGWAVEPREEGGGGARISEVEACALAHAAPGTLGFSMGFPICSRDSPERVAATAGFARRDPRGI